MPAPASMTFAEAVTEVLARVGQLDDGVANPLMSAEAKAHLNSAQRKLIAEHGLQSQRRRVLLPVAAGRRFVDLPANCRQGQIKSAVWVGTTGARTALSCGITSELSGSTGQSPGWYDLTPSTGICAVAAAGGTGYLPGIGTISGGARLADGHNPVVTFAVTDGIVTGATILDPGSQWTAAPYLDPLFYVNGLGAVVTATLGDVLLLELAPLPSDSGTLEVEYQASVVKMIEDADVLALDAEAVISRAAFMLASIKGLPCAVALQQEFISYMAPFRAQQTPGRVFSLSGWRSGR